MCLAIAPLRGYPGLNVILFDLAEPKVAAAVNNDAVGDVERLHELLCILAQFLVPLHAHFMAAFAEHHHLHFVKLVDSLYTARIFTVTSRLAAVARREGDGFFGKFCKLKRLVHRVAHGRRLCSTREVLAILGAVEVLLALREVAGAQEGLLADDCGCQEWLKSFLDQGINSKAPERKREKCGIALEEVAAKARDLCAALKVQHPQSLHELNVIFGSEGELGNLAPLRVFQI